MRRRWNLMNSTFALNNNLSLTCHTLQLFSGNHVFSDRTNNCECRTGACECLRIRPLCTSDVSSSFEQIDTEFQVVHLVWLVILVDWIPATSCSSSTTDLSLLLERSCTSSLTGSTVPAPVNSTLATSWIMCNLEQSLSCFFHTNISETDKTRRVEYG